MNTPLPVKAQTPPNPTALSARQKVATQKPHSRVSTGKACVNLSLRYPKELEHCFVLGNN